MSCSRTPIAGVSTGGRCRSNSPAPGEGDRRGSPAEIEGVVEQLDHLALVLDMISDQVDVVALKGFLEVGGVQHRAACTAVAQQQVGRDLDELHMAPRQRVEVDAEVVHPVHRKAEAEFRQPVEADLDPVAVA